MNSLIVVIWQTTVYVLLQFLNASVNFLSESYGIKFLLYGSVKTFTDSISFGTFGFSFRVMNIFTG